MKSSLIIFLLSLCVLFLSAQETLPQRDCESLRDTNEELLITTNVSQMESVCAKTSLSEYENCKCQTYEDWKQYRKNADSDLSKIQQFRNDYSANWKKANELEKNTYLMASEKNAESINNSIKQWKKAIQTLQYTLTQYASHCSSYGSDMLGKECEKKIQNTENRISGLEQRIEEYKEMLQYFK